jgi:hypothetical protein
MLSGTNFCMTSLRLAFVIAMIGRPTGNEQDSTGSTCSRAYPR